MSARTEPTTRPPAQRSPEDVAARAPAIGALGGALVVVGVYGPPRIDATYLFGAAALVDHRVLMALPTLLGALLLVYASALGRSAWRRAVAGGDPDTCRSVGARTLVGWTVAATAVLVLLGTLAIRVAFLPGPYAPPSAAGDEPRAYVADRFGVPLPDDARLIFADVWTRRSAFSRDYVFSSRQAATLLDGPPPFGDDWRAGRVEPAFVSDRMRLFCDRWRNRRPNALLRSPGERRAVETICAHLNADEVTGPLQRHAIQRYTLYVGFDRLRPTDHSVLVDPVAGLIWFHQGGGDPPAPI
ncbi:MAG: hypothetical protein RID91_17880 [Azospirillaceae bacterium]